MKIKNSIYSVLLTIVFSSLLTLVAWLYDDSFEYSWSNFVLGWWTSLFYVEFKRYLDIKKK